MLAFPSFLLLADPAVQAALISALGSILAALIAAACAALIGKRFVDQQRLRSKLRLAVADVQFLLQVEAAHCDVHVRHETGATKLGVRELVRAQGAARWSGAFTPGRARLAGLLDEE
jgi:hypothetical protein